MGQQFSRARRVGEQIRRDLAELLRTEVKDPRVALVTICGVEVNRDLSHAKVFVSVLDPAQPVEPALEALAEAAVRLRQVLGKRMRIRSVPRLHFFQDQSIEQGSRMAALINEAVASDRARHEPDDGEPEA